MNSGRSALIGHTGFVGGNLAATRGFDVSVSSTTIADLTGSDFDLVVCAGVSAVKWQANKDPEADRRGIARLTAVLESMRVREFILISTIDVYPDPGLHLDEDARLSDEPNHAYGRHRWELEAFVGRRFANVRIVRLPALFGRGLKKNVIFDLLNGNQTTSINPAAVFQWYPVRRLADDIDLIRAAELSLVNLFPEPLKTADILTTLFPGVEVGKPVVPAPHYRLQTKYSSVFGGPRGFHSSDVVVLKDLAEYVASERRIER